jgi:hypothetical protein
MIQRKYKNSEFTNSIMAIIIASMLTIIVTGGVLNNNNSILLPMANAQKPHHAEYGSFGSIQNGKDGKPTWLVEGIWDFKNMNSNSPIFNGTFKMFMLDGSAAHTHTIRDFKMTGSPSIKGNTTTFNGTATVSLKQGPVKDVPISITLMGDTGAKIWIDPSKTENHFGNTPIYGMQLRVSHLEPPNT